MMNTLVFVFFMMIAEVAIVLIAYSLGHAAGWLEGWEDRRAR
jgi:hypothetical protein